MKHKIYLHADTSIVLASFQKIILKDCHHKKHNYILYNVNVHDGLKMCYTKASFNHEYHFLYKLYKFI